MPRFLYVYSDRTLGNLSPGPHRLEVKLATNDAMPFDNLRFGTFLVRGARQVLALADDPADARIWRLALDATGNYRCVVKPTAAARDLDATALLAAFRVVCLVGVKEPDRELWEVLDQYVRKGGQLLVVPGDGLNPDAYQNTEAARGLMPGRWQRLRTAPAEPGVPWEADVPQHALVAPFREWKKSADVDFLRPELLPRALHYWEVSPDEKAAAVVAYAVADRHPALVERAAGQGRVLLFTTGMDGKRVKDKPYWNNYLESSFYLVLANQAVAYLTGDAELPTLNYLAGQAVTIPLPVSPRFPIYTLRGPGITGSDTTLQRGEDVNQLQVTKAAVPGNFEVLDGEGNPCAGFSLNFRPEECQLARVPKESIEAVLGADSVLPLDRAASFRQALQGHWRQPVELFPALMLLVLAVFVLENFLANKFYQRPAGAEEAPK
jgi:hypothetical protein